MARRKKDWRKPYQAIDDAGWKTQIAFDGYVSFQKAVQIYADENDFNIGELMREAIAKHIGYKGPLHHPHKEENGYTLLNITIDEVAWIRYLKVWKWSRPAISRKLRISRNMVNKMLRKDKKNSKLMEYFPSIPPSGEMPPWYNPSAKYQRNSWSP